MKTQNYKGFELEVSSIQESNDGKNQLVTVFGYLNGEIGVTCCGVVGIEDAMEKAKREIDIITDLNIKDSHFVNEISKIVFKKEVQDLNEMYLSLLDLKVKNFKELRDKWVQAL